MVRAFHAAQSPPTSRHVTSGSPSPLRSLIMAPLKQKRPAVGKKAKRGALWKFSLDLTHPVEDGILDSANFETFLKERIKVNGKTGNLGNTVQVGRMKNKINVSSDKQFSKRYLKYLTKKYLKKNNLRDWLRVVASDKETYELRYFQISQEDEESETDE
ncbi:60S ribosomal protein L22-like 1 isoform X1 [Labrus mixtus]|uniref:60S ribosomal protein L22-like 1 isoform X1 n=1 Tax=Labrus mixtus TaxID=508554 RepID=UPI0029C06B44|nr:60S ribosomal protein L22-like 1 isoform X1 [Labrus mixtus]